MDYLGFVITSHFLKNPQSANDMAFHRIFPFYGNLYIPKHWELDGFSRTLNLQGSEEYGKSLCFPILFPYWVNSLFRYFGNCIDFGFIQNIEEINTFKMFVFYHTLSVFWEFTFHIFWELYGFLFNPKYLRNHKFEMFGLPHTFPVLWEFTFPIFWEFCGFLLQPKCLKNL